MDQREIIMLVKVGTPTRYMSMMAPDLIEWVPMSKDLKTRVSLPRSCVVVKEVPCLTFWVEASQSTDDKNILQVNLELRDKENS